MGVNEICLGLELRQRLGFQAMAVIRHNTKSQNHFKASSLTLLQTCLSNFPQANRSINKVCIVRLRGIQAVSQAKINYIIKMKLDQKMKFADPNSEQQPKKYHLFVGGFSCEGGRCAKQQ